MPEMVLLVVFSILGACANAQSSSSPKRNVYAGPTTCDEGEQVKSGDYLRMHYTGTIDKSSATGEPGKQFDSSRDRGETFGFQIGTGQVIQGWDQGLLGLCKGAKATLVIPPDMGYGDGGAGDDIPGGATLNFDVEVVDVSDKEIDAEDVDADYDGPQQVNAEDLGDADGESLFKEIDTDLDGKLSKDEVLAYFKTQGEETLPDGFWEEEDTDKDGFIQKEEFFSDKQRNSEDEL